MTNTAGIPGDRICSFIERVERIDEEMDPNLPQALTGKAHAQLLRLFDFRSGDWTEVLLDADQAADRVLAAQPNNAMAHFVKALVLGGRRQYDAALASANAAIAIDPNFAHAYAEKAHLRRNASSKYVIALLRFSRVRPALTAAQPRIALSSASGLFGRSRIARRLAA